MNCDRDWTGNSRSTFVALAASTGIRSVAINTAPASFASVEGDASIAIVTDDHSKAKGALGCWLVLTERDTNGHIRDIKAFKVDGNTIKPDTWYRLQNGQPTEDNNLYR